MDILYVIGRGSKWNNNELRYSLRSIEKYGANIGRIFIAGYCPEFINKNVVTYIPCPDIYSCKHKNILNCIETAVALSDISDEFLLSSDDHFYIKHTDFDNYPIFRKGMLPNHVEAGDEYSVYRESLVSTYKLLKACNLPVNNFSWHGNTHFNKRLFSDQQFKDICTLSYILPEGCEPTCLMLNYQLAHAPFVFVDRNDRKLNENEIEGDFISRVGERECISCTSNVNKTFAQWLQKEFPNKSKYELYV